jgi:hypothetical protein
MLLIIVVSGNTALMTFSLTFLATPWKTGPKMQHLHEALAECASK